MKSQTFTVPPLLGCLSAADKYLHDSSIFTADRKVIWTGVNEDQKKFVERFVSKIDDINGIRDVLRMIAHKESGVINRWLADNGYTISLSGEDRPDTFCVASILDVLVAWLAKGIETTVKGSFPAVKLKDGVVILTGNGNPVASVKTKSEEVVFMRVIDEEPTGPMGIADVLHTLPKDMSPDSSYDSVVFPMIDYDQHIDISWLMVCLLATRMTTG